MTENVICIDAPRAHHLDRRADSIAAQAEGADSDELLSTPALADWLGYSPQWLEIGRSRGYGPPFIRLGPRRVRYRRRDVLAWLAERTHRRTDEYQDAKCQRRRPAASPVAGPARRAAPAARGKASAPT